MTTQNMMRWLGVLLMLSTAPCWATDYQIDVGGGSLTFSPSTLTVNVGDTVTFFNQGGFHNVVADDGSFGNAPDTAPWVLKYTFTKAGVVGYHCAVHGAPGAGMFGSITVNAAPPPAVNIGPGFTGAWYDPKQSGHGLFIEILPNGQILAWWFAFSPDGAQSWFGGVGTYSGNTAVIGQGSVNQTLGGKWIPNFDPAKTTNVAWGTLTFTFTDCNNGRVDFTSTVPGYGSGSMTLSRLTQPAGLTCP